MHLNLTWNAEIGSFYHPLLGAHLHELTCLHAKISNTELYLIDNAPVKLFYPHPPGDITFWEAAPVSLSLYFSRAPPYLSTLITLFSSAPPSFITHIFRLTPGLPRVDGERTV